MLVGLFDYLLRQPACQGIVQRLRARRGASTDFAGIDACTADATATPAWALRLMLGEMADAAPGMSAASVRCTEQATPFGTELGRYCL